VTHTKRIKLLLLSDECNLDSLQEDGAGPGSRFLKQPAAKLEPVIVKNQTCNEVAQCAALRLLGPLEAWHPDITCRLPLIGRPVPVQTSLSLVRPGMTEQR